MGLEPLATLEHCVWKNVDCLDGAAENWVWAKLDGVLPGWHVMLTPAVDLAGYDELFRVSSSP